MGTWNAFYVKDPDRTGKAIAEIRKDFPEAKIDEFEDFLGIQLANDAFIPPEGTLNGLSKQLRTDVIWLGIQANVDAFQFHHWRDGVNLRSLVYGCDREGIWERVEGAAEAWEAGAFFDSDSLRLAISHGSQKSKRDELKRIWRERIIATGQEVPRVSAGICAHVVGNHYRLPHY